MFFRKKEEEPKFKKAKLEDDYQWDKRKILATLLFIVIFVLVGLELKRMFLPNSSILGAAVQNKPVEIQKPSVKAPKINFSSSLGSSILDIKNNVGSLNAAD